MAKFFWLIGDRINGVRQLIIITLQSYSESLEKRPREATPITLEIDSFCTFPSPWSLQYPRAL